MEIRNTILEDLDAVLDIYDKAKQYMRENGNLNQWVNGYPSRELVTTDINKGISYVCIDNNEIVATFCYIPGIDPTYIHIYEGSWLNDEPYSVIHRIASISHQKGVATYCLDWCFKQCNNLRIDTHRDNIIMQKLVLKNGFQYCGIIYLADGDERLAYQKI